MDLKKQIWVEKNSNGSPAPVCNWYPLATVLPLCSHGTVLDFMIKNTRLQRQLTHSENTQKMHCNANHKHCATHSKPETKKMGYTSSNVCVCLYNRSLKLITLSGDHSDFTAV